MSFSQSDIARLKKLVKLALSLLESVEGSSSHSGNSKRPDESKTRIRRTGKDLIVFRKMLKAERKKGVPVQELARRHGISAAYIYQLGA